MINVSEDRVRFNKLDIELKKIKTRLRKMEMMLIRIEGLCETLQVDEGRKLVNLIKKEEVKR